MALRRLHTKKEFDIVSLIDIVFLLLIFGVVLSVMSANRGRIAPNVTPVQRTITFKYVEQFDAAGQARTVVLIDTAGTPIANIAFPPHRTADTLTKAQFAALPESAAVIHCLDAFAARYTDNVASSSAPPEARLVVCRDTKFRYVGLVMDATSVWSERLSCIRIQLEVDGGTTNGV